jgi:hypothetical protein
MCKTLLLHSLAQPFLKVGVLAQPFLKVGVLAQPFLKVGVLAQPFLKVGVLRHFYKSALEAVNKVRYQIHCDNHRDNIHIAPEPF